MNTHKSDYNKAHKDIKGSKKVCQTQKFPNLRVHDIYGKNCNRKR